MSKTPLVKTSFCPAPRRRARSERRSPSERIFSVDIRQQSSMRGLVESSRGQRHAGARTSCPPERAARTAFEYMLQGVNLSGPGPLADRMSALHLPFTICHLPFTIIVSVQDAFMTVPFLEDNDQTQARREHLESLRQLVGNVYPNKFERSNVSENTSGEDTITSIVATFKKFEPQVAEGQKPSPEDLEAANTKLNRIHVRIAGRIAAPPRVMGKAAFVHLSDGTSRLQIYVRRQDISGVRNDTSGGEVSGWDLFNLLDHGDFIGVDGYLFVTRTGELSVHVEKLQFLAKALLPMPDKMHGINDPEIRQRQRYADLIAGSLKLEERDANDLTPREVFELRSKVVREIRRFLDDHGYVEVETPMLTPLATGAAAKPFKTHHNALDIDLYARIAPELYLKRLVVGGFEKVYELNRNFRNEGISAKHNPEFTMLEFYMAYADVNQMMDFAEKLLRSVVYVALGQTRVRYGEHEIDFSQPFQRMTMKEAIAKHWFQKAPMTRGQFSIDWLDDPAHLTYLAAYDDLLTNGFTKEARCFLRSPGMVANVAGDQSRF